MFVALIIAQAVAETAKQGENETPALRRLYERQAEFVAFAVEYGLCEDDAWRLSVDLYAEAPSARGTIECWGRHKAPIAPLLVRVLKEWELPTEYQGSRAPLFRLKLYRWLGYLRNPKGVDYMISLAETILDVGVNERDDLFRLDSLFISLGESGLDNALDFLFLIQSREYWAKPDAPDITVAPTSVPMGAEEQAAAGREYVQERAYYGIVLSGTERALDTLATGEGINPRLTGLLSYNFGEAARIHVGIYGLPEAKGLRLSKEQHRQLKDIYKKYGKKYVPREVEKVRD